MPSVAVHDATVSYELMGSPSEPAMVLVSGTGGTMHSNWGHLVPTFSKKRRILLVDYSGSGKTTDDGGPLSVQMLVDQIMAAVQAASLDRFDLVGYSLGSCLSMTIAAQYPERVRSMVLLAGFFDGSDRRNTLQAGLWLDLIERDPVLFARMIVLSGMKPERVSAMTQADINGWIQAIVQNNDWKGISRQIDLDRRLNVTGVLDKILAPTLVIGCKYDQVAPISHSREMARRINGSSYAELDAGHLAPFEQAHEFAQLVMGFVG